jgi:hypothetical protein
MSVAAVVVLCGAGCTGSGHSDRTPAGRYTTMREVWCVLRRWHWSEAGVTPALSSLARDTTNSNLFIYAGAGRALEAMANVDDCTDLVYVRGGEIVPQSPEQITYNHDGGSHDAPALRLRMPSKASVGETK